MDGKHLKLQGKAQKFLKMDWTPQKLIALTEIKKQP